MDVFWVVSTVLFIVNLTPGSQHQTNQTKALFKEPSKKGTELIAEYFAHTKCGAKWRGRRPHINNNAWITKPNQTGVMIIIIIINCEAANCPREAGAIYYIIIIIIAIV